MIFNKNSINPTAPKQDLGLHDRSNSSTGGTENVPLPVDCGRLLQLASH